MQRLEGGTRARGRLFPDMRQRRDDTDDDDPTDYAEERTGYSEDRTLLANERTFAGWVRTSLAAVAVALGMRALFRGFEPDWLAKLAATGFIVTALVVLGAALRNALVTERRLTSHAARPQPRRRLALIAAMVAVPSVAAGVILWFL
jgi:putative membrane protein